MRTTVDIPDPVYRRLKTEAAQRALTAIARFAHQQWPDAYLAAFARAAGLTLVTFDQALGKLAGKECVLLA